MKKILFLFLLFAFECSKETGCVDITDKSQGDGEYYFFWGYGTMSSDTGNPRPIKSGSVTEEVYNQYKVGDTYCVD